MTDCCLLIIVAVALDLLIGDPQWRFHPVRCIGTLVAWWEKRLFPTSRLVMRERGAGCLMVAAVLASVIAIVMVILAGAQTVHSGMLFAVSVGIAYFSLAARALVNEAAAVAFCCKSGDLQKAREALSMIVGRDTGNLDEKEIITAVIETVAENITDGIVAPLFYLAAGGPVAAMAFKTISTMDSMIGYKNKRYRFFGTCAARCDDMVNFIPARLTAFILIPLVAYSMGKDGRGAFRIVLRDRHNHESPNSAHGEAAIAGALGIQLGGGATYNGIFNKRPVLGDEHTAVTTDLIYVANRITIGVTLLMTIMLCMVHITITTVTGG